MTFLWELRTCERGTVEVGSGPYLVTLHAPDHKSPGGYIAIEKHWSSGKLRPLHAGPLGTVMQDTTSQRLPGQLARSVRAEWSDTALALAVHAAQGRCGMWCYAGTCPLAPVQDSTAG